MDRHQFHFFVAHSVAVGDAFALDDADRRHLEVLRAREGARLSVADAAGVVLECELTDPDAGMVIARATQARPQLHSLRIELYACLIEAGRRWNDLIDQSVQAGADAIVPVIETERERGIAARRQDRGLRVIEAAAKQSRRARRPELAAPVTLAEAMPGACGILLDPDTDHQLVSVARQQVARRAPDQTIRVLVGSPKGIPATAVGDLVERGWHAAGMGTTILRSELAAAGAVLTVLQCAAEWGPRA